MLTTGLEILRVLAEAQQPLTATAIAERVGLHVSNVSRTLRVLAAAGYVCKPTYHSFAPDLGTLALAGAAATRLPLIARTRELVRDAAASAGMLVVLTALFRDQVLYLHRCSPGHEPESAIAGGWPLHRSVAGLRLLCDLPAGEAEAALATAARRYGWERPTPATPADPAACMAAARARLRDGILAIDGWDEPGRCSLAMAVQVAGQPPLALAIDHRVADPAAAAVQACAHLAALAVAIRTRLEQP